MHDHHELTDPRTPATVRRSDRRDAGHRRRGRSIARAAGDRGTPAPRRTSVLVAVLALCAPVALINARPAAAQVPTCDALTLYGNAANSGLCKSLSPGSQNLWVCELTGVANPDVHTTFNAAIALHVTVRTPTCQGNSTLAGNWPNALTIAAQQPAMVCNVSIQNWVDRLNAVAPVQPQGNATACTAGFLAAGGNGKITQSVVQSYINLCNQSQCP